jgi:hypothetical protein
MNTKITFLAGGAVGFFLGSKAGPRPYQQLDSLARRLVAREDVQQLVEQAKDVTSEQVGAAADKVGAKLRSVQGNETGGADVVMASDRPVETYADPQDLQFSKAAAEKEEKLDTLLEQGVPVEELDRKEEELRQEGKLSEPGAGNKGAD